MIKFGLTEPRKVYFKFGGVERVELISTITAGPLTGLADHVEGEARRSLVRSARHMDGRTIALEELAELDISGALRAAYQQALARARGSLAAADAE